MTAVRSSLRARECGLGPTKHSKRLASGKVTRLFNPKIALPGLGPGVHEAALQLLGQVKKAWMAGPSPATADLGLCRTGK